MDTLVNTVNSSLASLSSLTESLLDRVTEALPPLAQHAGSSVKSTNSVNINSNSSGSSSNAGTLMTVAAVAAGLGILVLLKKRHERHKLKPVPEGTVTIITGASSGIGKDISLLYAKLGSNLVLGARRENLLTELAAQCRALNPNIQVETFVMDVSNEKQCAGLIEHAIKKFGRIDTLILNAGIGQSFFLSSAEDSSAFSQFMDVNYYGAVWPTYYALSHLKKSKGRVVAVASLGGLVPFPRQTLYNATKYALVGFFGSLRLEVVNFGVSVSICCPGFVKTAMTSGAHIGKDGKVANKKASNNWMMRSDDCAREIVLAAQNRQPMLIVPYYYRPIVSLGYWSPFLQELVISFVTKTGRFSKLDL